ncbi:SCO family protein [Labrenzia sp. CP4]|uniref:SCO family protein n=1 Tax=Labrenzia sp. CP4 TaxID=1674922 RepID=UPI000AA468D7
MTSTKTRQLERIRISLWILVAAAVLALSGVYFVRTIWVREPSPPITVGEAAIRSDFSLIDHNGNRVTEADFLGRWQLVFFGFTYCPDVCPTTLAYLGNVLDRLGGEVEHVAPIFITVDPSRDTPQVMAEYVQAFHPKLVGLTGSEAEVAAAAQSFRVYYEKNGRGDGSGRIPDGTLRAHLSDDSGRPL